jgi:hypothetical protein
MALKSYMDELKVIKRGEYYLTPLAEKHIDELLEVLSDENIEEIKLLGYSSPKQALTEMHEGAEAYIVRKGNSPPLCVGGIFYDSADDTPQMFAMFSRDMKDNFHAISRGSKMFVNFFDQSHDAMTMTILAKFSSMLNWATWLGFEPVGISEHRKNEYVEFVRCNPLRKNVSDELSRPVMH